MHTRLVTIDGIFVTALKVNSLRISNPFTSENFTGHVVVSSHVSTDFKMTPLL